MFTGDPGAGFWNTVMAGVNWEPIFDAITEVSSVGAIEVAPADPKVIYDGTGDMVTGGAINRARAGVIAQGIEVADSHHQRKATSENKKPTRLADVYGRTWTPAGPGAVRLLGGAPADPIAESTPRHRPAAPRGPLG